MFQRKEKTRDVRVNYHVLIYARNTVRDLERFGVDKYAEEYVDNSLTRIKAILTSGEFIYRRLRDELCSLEKTIRSLAAASQVFDTAVSVS